MIYGFSVLRLMPQPVSCLVLFFFPISTPHSFPISSLYPKHPHLRPHPLHFGLSLTPLPSQYLLPPISSGAQTCAPADQHYKNDLIVTRSISFIVDSCTISDGWRGVILRTLEVTRRRECPESKASSDYWKVQSDGGDTCEGMKLKRPTVSKVMDVLTAYSEE